MCSGIVQQKSDRAKKEFVISNARELADIRTKYKTVIDNKTVKPYFFAHIAKQKGFYVPEKKYYKHYMTSMDYVQDVVNRYRCSKQIVKSCDLLKFSDIIDRSGKGSIILKDVNYKVVNSAIQKLTTYCETKRNLYANDNINPRTRYMVLQNMSDELSYYFSHTKFSYRSLSYLFKVFEDSNSPEVIRLIVFYIFSSCESSIYNILKKQKCPLNELVADETGGIIIFGHRYDSRCVNAL